MIIDKMPKLWTLGHKVMSRMVEVLNSFGFPNQGSLGPKTKKERKS